MPDEKNFIVKDSGEREEFDTGAVRDTDDGKPLFSLIPPRPLRRLAMQYTRGKKKYGKHNWTQGMPTSRYLDSALRHIQDYMLGEDTEDHLAAAIFNLMGVMEFQDTSMDDRFAWEDVIPLMEEKIHQAKMEKLEDLRAATAERQAAEAEREANPPVMYDPGTKIVLGGNPIPARVGMTVKVLGTPGVHRIRVVHSALPYVIVGFLAGWRHVGSVKTLDGRDICWDGPSSEPLTEDTPTD